MMCPLSTVQASVQETVITCGFVEHFVELRELSTGCHHRLTHHEGRSDGLHAIFVTMLQSKLDQGLVKKHPSALQEVSPPTCKTTSHR